MMNHSNGDNGAHFFTVSFQWHLLIVAFVHLKKDGSSGSSCQIVGFRNIILKSERCLSVQCFRHFLDCSCLPLFSFLVLSAAYLGGPLGEADPLLTPISHHP